MGVGLKLEGRLLRRRGRMMEMQGKAFRDDTGALVATAQARFMEAGNTRRQAAGSEPT